jgi:hypothetical protein
MDAALAHWTKTLRVGPFLLLRPLEGVINYRGDQQTIKIALAMAMWGDLLIELISPLDKTPSIYNEFLAGGHQGLHHMATLCKDYDQCIADLVCEKVPILQHGDFGATRYSYMDTVGNYPGTMVEVVEINEEILGMLNLNKRLSETWDGTDPVRPFVL